MIPGVCKLCLKEKMLCDSHLAPSALYKFCEAKELGPVRMTPHEISVATEEVSDYLLCEICENFLNKHSENWLIPKLATIEKRFPFYDILTEVPPDTGEDGSFAYACSRNRKIAVRKLTNFAVGVFWKASVHPWIENRRDPLIELGKYREGLRRFLRHEDKFPAKCTLLTVGIMPPAKAVIGFNLPQLRTKQPFHQYLFYVPGITFVLSVGKQISAEEQALCFYSNPLHPIVVSDFSESIYGAVRRGIRNATPSEEVKNFLTSKRPTL